MNLFTESLYEQNTYFHSKNTIAYDWYECKNNYQTSHYLNWFMLFFLIIIIAKKDKNR